MMRKIGIVAPNKQAWRFATASVQLSLRGIFKHAIIQDLGLDDLMDRDGFKYYDMLILPPSDGHDTPYRHFMKGEIAENIGNYARRGSIAAFCSGAYAVIKQFSYTYPNGVTECYDGYVPLIDAMARGPEDSGFRDREEGVRFDDVRILPVFSHVAAGPKQLDLCYANGPSFDPQGLQGRDDIRILSSFLSGKISILAKQMPEGGVVVCFGSLPEIQSAHIPAHSSEAMTLMKNKMEVAEAGRRELWDISMKILESRSLYPA